MYELEMLSHLESSSWCEKFICGRLINYVLVTKWWTHDSFSRKVTTWKIIMMMMVKLWSPWKNNDNNNDDSIDNDQSLMVLIDDNSDSSRKSLWRKVLDDKKFFIGLSGKYCMCAPILSLSSPAPSFTSSSSPLLLSSS